MIETVTELTKRRVGSRSLTDTIDTTTPGGRLVFHIFGALGQFERDLIQDAPVRASPPPRRRAAMAGASPS